MLVSATLVGVGSEAASPPWWFLFQKLVYLIALAYKLLSNVESLEGSDLEGSVDFFCLSGLLVIHRPNSTEVLLLSTWLADLLGSSFTSVPCLYQVISEILGMTALQLRQCTRNYCPILMLFSSCYKEGLLGWLP